jgi:enoyl-CoA hydratase/carnithine racemase
MSDVSEQELLIERNGSVATVTLNRPRKRNALSMELLAGLDDALLGLGQDTEVRAVVLRADGPVFSSGHDLKQMIDRSREDYAALFSQCATTMQRLRQIPQPVIAAVHGLATAAGCQLVASCDLIVATDTAWFATPGVKIGLFCTTPMVPLVRSIPPKIAMEMLLTGNPLSAQRAYELGFVNRVVPEAELQTTVDELTSQIVGASRATIATGKAAFYQQLSMQESEAYAEAVEVMTENSVGHDAQEGIQAFLEKRQPEWQDR